MTNCMIDLTGKVAIVTGAASFHGDDDPYRVGQGSSTASLFAQLGAKVVLADINGEVAEQRAKQIRADGGDAIAVETDVRVEEQVQRMIATAVDEFGRLDILHNNAADLRIPWEPGDPPITEFVGDSFRAQIETLLLGPMLGCKHAIPAMVNTGGGSITCTSSISGEMGELNLTTYGVAKAGVNQLVRAVSAQHGKQGIRCNAVAPGLVLSSPSLQLGDELITQYTRHCDTPHVGQPEDIARVVAFLHSNAARYITGQVIRVDGGFTEHSPMVTEGRASGLVAGTT
ncbi:SDR family NAD(P)-dependent oxidoreductase [Rhodococcus opacus]|uniref:SDR family NAD(P)-dependent oxidoreductase n=1 Tax=Rhodococcus opacus TaxID=37919 RepID=UPI0021C63A93|nr:SDR family oxidoreductase [Rhodococcus opacus]